MIIEANWANFRTKFSGKEQKSFEFFCSLLFYTEHNKPTGALRYLNHPGLEANPVAVANDVIGWQAKFLDSSAAIGRNKGKLIKALDDAKGLHPTLTKVYFYLNVDFPTHTRNRGNDPTYKAEVEAHARALGIEAVWKTASFFESPFVCQQNADVASHFFLLGASVIDFIQELERHSRAVLALIRSEIVLNGRTIKIDRSAIVKRLKEMLLLSPFVIVAGDAGVGKTAVLKDFYNEAAKNSPFFVLKATEFNVTHINQLLKDYGAFTLSDLVREYQDVSEKFFVVDSAEKLAELERPEVFQEFLSTLRNAGWKMLFTARLSYLEDLKYVFAEIYGVAFDPLNVPNLTTAELNDLAEAYKFALPEDTRFRALLQNPFYLNEYLSGSPGGNAVTTYSAFRDAIWSSRVVNLSYQRGNAHRKREECFLEMARLRARSGRFFVTVAGYDEPLRQLEADEIIKFDSGAGGYFIAHDIYEEWALERVINRIFLASCTIPEFYWEIGDSLAIRRAFRGWLSDKLVADDSDASRLIKATVGGDDSPRHWKDEAIVAALLSQNSSTFIDVFHKALLVHPSEIAQREGLSSRVHAGASIQYDYENSLLYRVLFLLRIACKEVDQSLLNALGAIEGEAFSFSSFITRPRGTGWASVIAFLNAHRETLGLIYLRFVVPILDDWNRYNKVGETTKAASQLALYFFNEITKGGDFPYWYGEETKEQLISVMFNGAAEIRVELATIFGDIAETKDISRQSRYHELAKAALGAITKSAIVAQALPKEVIALGMLFWPYMAPQGTGWSSDYRNDIEQYFDLADDHHELYPASAYQTPTLRLLQVAPKAAVDMVLWLTNRATDFFAQTEFAKHEVEEIGVVVATEITPIKQYICHRLWNIYRGTQVAPAILECMHMALERWLLDVGKVAEPEVLEQWCRYLLRNSRSASITAVVVSIVLAQPSKLFKVALDLFRNEAFFFHDTARVHLDTSARSHYSISHDPTGIHTRERLGTCDDKHRTQSIEDLALRYQVFRSEGESEEIAKVRQEAIWEVLDQHYARLPTAESETEKTKTWRLCLARMDRRKMSITTENRDGQVQIAFNPEIDPELRKYSESTLAKSADLMKYMALNLWARYKFERNESECKKYPQYENHPEQALADCRVVVAGIASNPGAEFALFYRAVPATTCAVLVRDYSVELDADAMTFCRESLLRSASRSFRTDYDYQIGDGVDAAISALPSLLDAYPESHDDVIRTLLFTLVDTHPAGIGQRFADHSISAVLNLWQRHPRDAEALFSGFLFLKPKFDAIGKAMRQESYEGRRHPFSTLSLFQRLEKEHETDIAKIISNDLTYSEVSLPKDLNIDVRITAFLLLPIDTKVQTHVGFVRETAALVAQKMTERDTGRSRFDAHDRHRFLQKFAHFVLRATQEDVAGYVQPFVEKLTSLNEAGDVFQEFVNAQVDLLHFDTFWRVWDLFYPSITMLCKSGSAGRRSSMAIHNYLFASPYWSRGIKEWNTLKDGGKPFFERVAAELGDNPDVLYALAKVMNDVGSSFAAEGIFWISSILERNPNIADEELKTNTIYYLDNFVRGYVLRNRHRVRSTPQIRDRVLIILNFLLQKGSVTAYLVREDIL